MDYFQSRWHGRVPLGRLFWRDLLVVGTMINLAFSFAALILVARGADGAWPAVVHFAPLPYNLFLLGSVWRAPGRSAGQGVAAALWFGAMLVV